MNTLRIPAAADTTATDRALAEWIAALPPLRANVAALAGALLRGRGLGDGR